MFGPSTPSLEQPPVSDRSDGPPDPDAENEPRRLGATTPYRLSEASVAFLAAHKDQVIGTSRVLNPLLELWEVAHDVSDEAAGPIERMLTVLVKRQYTSYDELVRMIDEVDVAVR